MYLFQRRVLFHSSSIYDHLHSTMYLFQRTYLMRLFLSHLIYIPLCIYFNVLRLHGSAARVRIYIPLCIYFNKHTFKLSQYPDTFTFHYVSISTVTKRSAVPCIYLIYIPLCIYFNVHHSSDLLHLFSIYIPLCIYFN